MWAVIDRPYSLARRLYREAQGSLPLDHILRLRHFVLTNRRIGHTGNTPAGRSIGIHDGGHSRRQRWEFFSTDHKAWLRTHNLDVKTVVLAKLIQFSDDVFEPRWNSRRAAADIDAGDCRTVADNQLNLPCRQAGRNLHWILFDHRFAVRRAQGCCERNGLARSNFRLVHGDSLKLRVGFSVHRGDLEIDLVDLNSVI